MKSSRVTFKIKSAHGFILTELFILKIDPVETCPPYRSLVSSFFLSFLNTSSSVRLGRSLHYRWSQILYKVSMVYKTKAKSGTLFRHELYSGPVSS